MAYNIGKCRLRYLLTINNMKQQDLANRTHIPRQRINDYVSGRRLMSLNVAAEFADILNCHVEDLYEFEYYNRSKKEDDKENVVQ